MPDYERYALILDSQDSQLGTAAMRLMALGIDVLYANDLDEAELLVRQEQQRLGAVLAPSSLGPEAFDRLLSRICSQLGAGQRTLVLAGAEPDEDLLRRLRADGVQWRLWEPYEEREMRFVVSAAMATEHGADRRKDPRIPTQIEISVFMGRHRKEVVVHDLSAGGAYLATPHPFLEGSSLRIEIPFADGVVHAKAEVVNAKTADKPGRRDVPDGMGVLFDGLSDASATLLRVGIYDWIRRFQL